MSFSGHILQHNNFLKTIFEGKIVEKELRRPRRLSEDTIKIIGCWDYQERLKEERNGFTDKPLPLENDYYLPSTFIGLITQKVLKAKIHGQKPFR